MLGYLDPERLAGGELKLQAALAREAIERHVATPLGLSVEEAARGIREVANASMARAIRSVTIERGRDPRDFTLVAFGGSGPAHACDVAAALDIRRVLVPVAPGVFTAVGMLASDVTHHFVRAAGGALEDTATLGRARTALDELSAEALATLAGEGYPRERVRDRGARRPALRRPGLRAGDPDPRRPPRGSAPRRSPGCLRPRVRRHLRLRERRAARARERPRGGHGTRASTGSTSATCGSSAPRTPSRSAGPCTGHGVRRPSPRRWSRAPPSRASPRRGRSSSRNTTPRWSSRRARPCPATPSDNLVLTLEPRP